MPDQNFLYKMYRYVEEEKLEDRQKHISVISIRKFSDPVAEVNAFQPGTI